MIESSKWKHLFEIEIKSNLTKLPKKIGRENMGLSRDNFDKYMKEFT